MRSQIIILLDSGHLSLSAKLSGVEGSFEDEGLDLSQRLAESMFSGPDLDTSARDVVLESGSRLQQAIRRLVDSVETREQVSEYFFVLKLSVQFIVRAPFSVVHMNTSLILHNTV